ncbi:MAG: PEP-CTERM sorting domain-containing protein [Pirellulales bacterium]
MKRFALVVAILALCVASANAASVKFRLKYNGVDKTWNLYGLVSAGDNGGLASWGAAVTKVSDIALRTPEVALSTEHGLAAAGFNQFKATAPSAFGSSQDTTKPGLNQEFGVGQGPGIVGGFPAAGIADVAYDYPVLLASGKLVGDGPFNRNNLGNLPVFTNATANVYKTNGQSGGLGDVVAAQMVTEVVPEPSTMVLAAFGLLGLVAFGFRRNK